MRCDMSHAAQVARLCRTWKRPNSVEFGCEPDVPVGDSHVQHDAEFHDADGHLGIINRAEPIPDPLLEFGCA